MLRWGVQRDCFRDWRRKLERLVADSSEVVRRHYQLVGGVWSESQSRWHISDSGEVGRQVHWSTAIHCLVGEYSTVTLKRMRSGTRSQWRLASASVMCSERRKPKIDRLQCEYVSRSPHLINLLDLIYSHTVHICNCVERWNLSIEFFALSW